jgi:hypothetical protein
MSRFIEAPQELPSCSTQDGSNHQARYNFGDVVTQALEANKRRLELERIANDEIRTGHFASGPRTAAPSEIESVIKRQPEIQIPTGFYDESAVFCPTPNYRDLARGEISQRSYDFQTGERSDEHKGKKPNSRNHSNTRRVAGRIKQRGNFRPQQGGKR